MRLKKHLIENLASMILEETKKKKLLTPRAKPDVIKERIIDVMIKDFQAEDALEEEAKRILESHSKSLKNSEADYHKTLQMIKQKLAKERKIVL